MDIWAVFRSINSYNYELKVFKCVILIKSRLKRETKVINHFEYTYE